LILSEPTLAELFLKKRTPESCFARDLVPLFRGLSLIVGVIVGNMIECQGKALFHSALPAEMVTRRVSEEITWYLANASGYQENPSPKAELLRIECWSDFLHDSRVSRKSCLLSQHS
jgi:hypothetical protein